jgi:hypothetical protein
MGFIFILEVSDDFLFFMLRYIMLALLHLDKCQIIFRYHFIFLSLNENQGSQNELAFELIIFSIVLLLNYHGKICKDLRHLLLFL